MDNGVVNITGSTKVNKLLENNRWWYLTVPLENATSENFNALDANTKLYYWNETNSGEHGWNRITDNITDLYGEDIPVMTGFAVNYLMENKNIIKYALLFFIWVISTLQQLIQILSLLLHRSQSDQTWPMVVPYHNLPYLTYKLRQS